VSAVERRCQTPTRLPVTFFTIELGITHAEFFRSLPPALADQPYAIQGNEVRIEERGRSIVLKLSPENTRALGRLQLPVTPVTFTFAGYSERAIEDFMAKFNRHFHRGGG
jgi:hypothetical protein